MSASSLFIDQDFKPIFEKIAAPVKVSDTPDNWQLEVASELHKQAPYLADYSVNVIIDKVDPERGYAFGAVEITNITDAPLPDQPQTVVRVPVIIKDRLLQPFDVFLVDNTAYPLNETRLRNALFRTDTFEMSTRKPLDQGIVDQLYPPLRTNYGYGSSVATGVGMGGFGKFASKKKLKKAEIQEQAEPGRRDTALPEYDDSFGKNPTKLASFGAEMREPISDLKYQALHAETKEGKDAAKRQIAEYRHMLKRASLVKAIAPTISDKEVENFVNNIVNDEQLRISASRNQYFEKSALLIASTDKADIEKTASTIVDSVKPTVVQLTKLASGNFKVKWANRSAYREQEDVVNSKLAAHMAGSDKVVMMNPDQTVTVSTESAKKETLSEKKVEIVKDFGNYSVVNAATGEKLAGWVLPIMDFEMQPLDLYLWTDNASYSVQDEIAGSRVGHDVNLQASQPQGNGAFFYVSDNNARALLPITINNTLTDQTGTISYQGETIWEEPITLMVMPGIQKVEELNPGHYAIPSEFQWLALGEKIKLVSDPLDVASMEEGQQAPGAVDVKSTGGGEFNMEGAPLQKVGREQRWFIKKANAEFLLVAMGMNPFDAKVKLAEASKYGQTRITNLKPIIPLRQLRDEAIIKAASILTEFPTGLRRNLLKEAAALEDSETVDRVMSLNFINPENISIFASYLPHLDETSQKLAEMLLAARLGMSMFPEGAIERAMKNMEEVIQGLKVLQQKQMV